MAHLKLCAFQYASLPYITAQGYITPTSLRHYKFITLTEVNELVDNFLALNLSEGRDEGQPEEFELWLDAREKEVLRLKGVLNIVQLQLK